MSLLDEVMDRWHFAEVHHADVDAPPRQVHSALLELEARDVVATRLLLELRELPARLRGAQPALGGGVVDAMESAGFRRLAEAPGEEVVWGIVGRFWHPWRNIEPSQPGDAAAFRAYAEPHRAKAAWNFRFGELPGGRTRVTTETRIQASDEPARRAFGRYWLLIRPASGLIRRELLRALARRAERTGGLAAP